jgi:hypothetical protein
MTVENIITELTGYMEKMQQFDKDAAQDGNSLHEYLISLTNYMARANYLMAYYGRKFREAKKSAYAKLAASSHAQNKYYSPSLAKDYVDSCCSESAYIFDLSERVSRTAVHTIDAVRTIVSSLKSERQFSNY